MSNDPTSTHFVKVNSPPLTLDQALEALAAGKPRTVRVTAPEMEEGAFWVLDGDGTILLAPPGGFVSHVKLLACHASWRFRVLPESKSRVREMAEAAYRTKSPAPSLADDFEVLARDTVEAVAGWAAEQSEHGQPVTSHRIRREFLEPK